MNSRRFLFFCLAVGALMILAGVALPPERVLHAVMPAKAAAFRDKLLAGLVCLKVALLVNGILLLLLRPLKRFLWDAPTGTTATMKPFYQMAAPGRLQPMEKLTIGGIIVLTLILRLIGSRQSLFGDEIAVQQMFISRGLPVIVTYFPYTPQHVLYSVLAFFFEKLPLPIELSYRLPAILFSTAAVALTWWIARRVFDRVTAAAIGVMSAVAFYGIIYAHNAKGYTATYFFATLAVLGLSQIVENWIRARGWVVLASALIGLSYAHLYNAYLCIGLTLTASLVILLAGWNHKPVVLACAKRFIFMLGIIGALLFLIYAMQIPQILEQARRASGQPEEHLSARFFHGWLMQMTYWGKCWPVALTLLALTAVGALSLLKREPRLAIALLLPAGVVILMAVTQKSWIYPRYMVFTLVPFLILTVEGVRALAGLINGCAARAAVIGLAAVHIGCTGLVLREYYPIGNQNIRGACVLAAAQSKPGDTIVAYGLARDLIPFYSSRSTVVTSLADLQTLMANATGDIYLIYGWRYAWHGREEEFVFIDKHFEQVRRFDGMLMDSVQPDGEMYLMVYRKPSAPPAPKN